MATVQMLRGVDTDNYDGPIPESHFRRLHDEYGIVFNIIGLEVQRPYAKAQQQAGYAAGVDNPFCYKFLYGANNDLERMKEAAGFGKPIAIDVEAELNLGVPGNIQRIHEAKDLLIAEGLYWGIYSSPNFWQEKTNNCMDFAGDYCWTATYPFINMPPPPTYMPDWTQFPVFGGMTPQIWQYSSKCYLDDQGPWDLDINAYQGIVAPPPPPRVWLYGDESGGVEKVGNQKFEWNNYVLTDIRGDEAGITPGLWMHNVGGNFIKLAD